MLIDDDHGEAYFVKDAMVARGITNSFEYFDNWKYALEYIKNKTPDLPDIIMVDLVFNGALEFDNFNRMAELTQFSESRSVLYSTMLPDWDIEKLFLGKHFKFIRKGVSVDQLEQNIVDVLK